MIGFYNVIKPTGVSSGYVVNKIKYITKSKVGHLGTLDPLATGVLPVAVGKATKLFDYFLKKDKRYFALTKFGVLTTTLDSEGEVIKNIDKTVLLKDVQNICKSFIGETLQYPPLFSARKKDGVRGYEAGLNGIDLKLEPKKVQIYSLSAKKWHQNNVFAINIHCSAGTYVRSIIRDIAEKLGTVATTVAIIRTSSGMFNLDSAVTIEEIEQNKEKCLLKINELLNLKEIVLSKSEAKNLLNGKSIKTKLKDGEYLTTYLNEEFSLVNAKNGSMTNKIYFYDKEII